ncbi:hypothetical protein Pint_24053 [Pistacia integerrima]|uniref:Uncharacterized protein n=1 Tax=Pistacia integerrima TaxID=434235 RepID=A0ACC0YLZ9_9ROSI|nr:hypothetical protein Pint_24053 [Pistacia integerrima]
MASSISSAASSFVIPNITSLVSVKLDGTNYLNWTTQFIPVLRSHDLLSIVDGSEECPPQYLVYDLTTSKMVWNALASRFAPQSQSHISHLKRQLQTLQQGNKTCFDYLFLAKSWYDQLTTTGKSVDEEDLISYVVVGGLNPIYNPFITSFNFATRDKSISFDDFQSKLLNYEQLLDSQNKSIPSDGTQFAFFTSKPKFHHGKKPKYPTQQAKPPSSPKPNPTTTPAYPSSKPQPSGSPFSTKFPPCQICGKPNHQALDCYHRMDFTYQGRHPPAQLAAMAAHTHVTQEDEQPWYLDSGANNHITSELENLTLQQQPYQGNDKVTIGNGDGLLITNIGSTDHANSSSRIE